MLQETLNRKSAGNLLPDMASYRCIWFSNILFKTDIGQGVLAKDGLGVQVCCHEATLALESLVGGEALHVGAGQQAVEVPHQVGQGRVHAHLVLPLKLCPHGPEE